MVNWSPAFGLQAQGVENPIVWLGFDPQPDPPSPGTILGFDPQPDPPHARLSMPLPARTNWTNLYPQPEDPPSGLFGSQAYGGFNFQFNHFSDLEVGFSLLDANGNPMPLAAVPEPQTYALLIAGFGLLRLITRNRRRQKRR